MVARRYFVSGEVQGVGFRYYVLREVERIGNISGFVRNRTDGSVEVFAQTEEASLKELEESLRKGPRSSRVSRLQIVEESPDSSYSDFRITLTAH
jgi:acylphosphatase